MPQLIEMTLQLLPGLLFLTFAIIALINLLSLRRRFPERRSAVVCDRKFSRLESAGTAGLGADRKRI